MNRLISLALSAFVASVCCAGDSASDAALRQTLSQVPAAELPAKAAELVKAAKTRDRGFLTADIVTISLSINPVATPAIVAPGGGLCQ